jgi:hypothetical protein
VEEAYIKTVAKLANTTSERVKVTSVSAVDYRRVALSAAGTQVGTSITYQNATVAPSTSALSSSITPTSLVQSYTQQLLQEASTSTDPAVQTMLTSLAASVTVQSLTSPVQATALPTFMPTPVPEQTSASKSISGGEIAAAVIMTIFGAVVIAALVWYFFLNKSSGNYAPQPSTMRKDDNLVKAGEMAEL